MDRTHRILQTAKWLVAELLFRTGLLAHMRSRRARRGEIAVLWLHRVAGDLDDRRPMGVPPGVFRDLVAHLVRHYRVLSWPEACRAVAESDHRAAAVVTFDDGYRDNAEIAWPILRDAGVTGVFCLTTGYVSDDCSLWWEEVAAALPVEGSLHPVNRAGEATYGARAEAVISELKELPDTEREQRVRELSGSRRATLPPSLTWDHARQMLSEGADFAAHSVRHPLFTRCENAALDRELRDGRSTIERELGQECRVLAYPNGSHDDRVVARARAAGYTHAFTIEKGVFGAGTDPMRVPRVGVSEPKYSRDGRAFCPRLFEAEMLGVFDALLLRRWRRRG